MARVDVLASSVEQRWVTPPALFRAVQRFMGGAIALDAAALAHTARVPSYLGPDHVVPDRRDALGDVSWSEWLPRDGAWWLNPPYGHGVHQWIRRAAAEGMYRPGAALVHANTDTEYFATCWRTAEWILLLRGRLAFLHPDTLEPITDASGRPVGTTGGHMVVIWRPGWRRACSVALVDHELRGV